MRPALALALAAPLALACGRPPSAREIGDCAACHAEQAAALAQSRHASAGGSPAFAGLRARAGADAALCDACHRPGGAPGLTCLTCHAAAGNRATENGQLLLDPDGPVRVGDSAGRSAPHAIEASGFLRSSDLCGTCHEVRGPGAFHERPLQSWQRSPAGRAGVTCQGCHLSPEPGRDAARPLGPVARGARTARPRADHRFVGLGAPAPDAAALLERGLAVRLLPPGDGQPWRLEVEATGEGHRALAGAGFVRELAAVAEWLDADGVARPLGEPLRLDVRMRRAGQPEADPLAADAWDDLGLEPGERRAAALPVPDGAARLRACLAYRPVRPELAGLLGLEPEPERRAGCVEAAP